MSKKIFTGYATSLFNTLESRHNQLITQATDDETIHQLRVSIRRIKPVITTLAELESSHKKQQRLKHHSKQLNTLFKTLSKPRDLEVQVKLATAIFQHDSDNQKLLEPYIATLGNEIQSLDNLLLTTISSLEIKEVVAFYNTYLNQIPYKKDKIINTLYELMSKQKSRYKKSLLPLQSDPEQFHETRIQLKQYRYFLELLSEMSAVEQHKLIQNLKIFQEKLGEANDYQNCVNLMTLHHVDKPLIDMVYHQYLQKRDGAVVKLIQATKAKL